MSTLSTSLKSKLKELPGEPGVYIYKDAKGKIIYVGKASILKRRVKSYFQKNHRDLKTPILVENLADLDWIVTGSEIEALFLESELIKRYKPVYNVDLRDDKNWLSIKVTTREDFPRVYTVRRPSDDGETYYGPFQQGYQVRQALRYLRRIFPYFSISGLANKSRLEHQIGVSPRPDISREDYRQNIRRLTMILSGKTGKLLAELEREMKALSRAKRYEQAADIRNKYLAIKALNSKMIFGAEETFDLTLDQALNGLSERLGLSGAPRRIEAYDISNFAGGDAVSSMVVFTDGVPNQSEYRKFKMRTKGPNDFAMMAETIRRRFTRNLDWSKPDLIIIDGGKGQLGAATEVMDELGVKIPTVGLAKREEEIVQRVIDINEKCLKRDKTDYDRIDGAFRIIALDHNSATLKLIQRVRDEAHRFAVSYHTTLRDKRTKTSELDAIPGIGPATRKKLIRTFGSVAGVKAASDEELTSVAGKKAKIIRQHLG